MPATCPKCEKESLLYITYRRLQNTRRIVLYDERSNVFKIDGGDGGSSDSFLQSQCDPKVLCSECGWTPEEFTIGVTPHPIEDPDERMKDIYRQGAKNRLFELISNGECEVDDDAVVEESCEGAWVAARIWVSNDLEEY